MPTNWLAFIVQQLYNNNKRFIKKIQLRKKEMLNKELRIYTITYEQAAQNKTKLNNLAVYYG